MHSSAPGMPTWTWRPFDALTARRHARVADHLLVALLVCDRQLLGLGEGVRACRRHHEAEVAQSLRGPRAQHPDRGDRLVDRGAHLGVELDDRCVELRLQRARQLEAVRFRQELSDCADRRKGLSVEKHDLLLDADRERELSPNTLLDH